MTETQKIRRVRYLVAAIVVVCLTLVLFGIVRLVYGAYGEIQDDGSEITSCWHFGGGATDSCGTNDGTIDGAVSTQLGYFGQAYVYSASGKDFIELDSSQVLNSSATWTISCWAKRTSGNVNHTVFGGLTGTARVLLGYKNNLTKMVMSNDAGDYTIHATAGIQTDTWYFIALVSRGDSTNYDIYLNDELSFTSPDGGTFTLAGFGRSNTNFYLDGTVDECIQYDTNLSAAEIKQIYSMQKGGYGIN